MPRADLPHRATLSRFLGSVDRPCLEVVRTLFEQYSFAEGWTSETIGGSWDRQGRRSIVFDVDATRQAARQRALPCDPTLPSPRRRLNGGLCVRLHARESEGRWYIRAPQLAEMQTRQWIGTYAGRGNGDYQGELCSRASSHHDLLEALCSHYAGRSRSPRRAIW